MTTNKQTNKQTSLSKRIKIIIVNFLLFLLLFHVADFYASQIVWQSHWIYKNSNENKIVCYIKNYRMLHDYSFVYNKKKSLKRLLSDNYNDDNKGNTVVSYRQIENKTADKSILLFGCSFAYGDGLRKDETFSYNLGKILPNYRIYNRAYSARSTSHMLYQLENKDFSEIPNIEYIIYVFVGCHLPRNYVNYCHNTPVYTISKGRVYQDIYTIRNIDIPLSHLILDSAIIQTFKNSYEMTLTKKCCKNLNFCQSLIMDSIQNL